MLRMLIVSALMALIVGLGGPTTAVAGSKQCGVGATVRWVNPCPVVPETSYHGGGIEVRTVQATACFTLRIAKVITRPNGTNEWTVTLVYDPSSGSHEVVRTMHNATCWTQNVAVGTWMAVYVTCPEYTGWVAVRVTGPGRYTMVPVPWRFQERIG